MSKFGSMVVAAALLGGAVPAYAATDGEQGETSTGTISVSAAVNAQPRQVQIQHLDDLDFGDITNASVGTTLTRSSNFCLTTTESSNNPNAKVKLSVHQAHGLTPFADRYFMETFAGSSTLIFFTLSLSGGGASYGNFTNGPLGSNPIVQVTPSVASGVNACDASSTGENNTTSRNLVIQAILTIPQGLGNGNYNATSGLTLLAAPD